LLTPLIHTPQLICTIFSILQVRFVLSTSINLFSSTVWHDHPRNDQTVYRRRSTAV